MKTLMEELTEETGIRPEILEVVVKRTLAHLHRGFYERHGQNGDYIGGLLVFDLPYDAYLHFIGMVRCLAEDYILGEPAEFTEYGDRVVPRDVHEAVSAEVKTWRRPESR
jgi:hypothetical protein